MVVIRLLPDDAPDVPTTSQLTPLPDEPAQTPVEEEPAQTPVEEEPSLVISLQPAKPSFFEHIVFLFKEFPQLTISKCIAYMQAIFPAATPMHFIGYFIVLILALSLFSTMGFSKAIPSNLSHDFLPINQ